MNDVKDIYLCDFDGEAFEVLCQKLLQKHYRADVEHVPLVGDGGKDLIVRFTQTDVMYIECKHHHKPIGRPAVQKLHSAMMTDGVKKGMIIATGGFTDDAKKHIRENRLNIETMDFFDLKSIGSEHGYRILLNPTSDYITICTLAPYDVIDIENIIKSNMGIRQSGKTKVDLDFEMLKNEREDRYAYRLHVSAHEDFKMTNGRLLKKLDKEMDILLDQNGLKTMPEISRIIKKLSDRDKVEGPMPIDMNIKQIESDVKEIMIRQFTEDISYVGNNGSCYNKTCSPKPKSVIVSFEYLLKYSVAHIAFGAFGLKSEISFIENKNDAPIILSKNIRTDGLCLCDDCRTLVKQIHTCSSCGRFTCKKCTLQYKKGLFSRWNDVCNDCSKKYSGQKVKLRKAE
ncbi:MAG: restriction endonuclease [Methanomassiliicoccaceae archaeon]|nr:restriction endonuclease [Methanomassiliicoccaceae archaeon]